jgi:hypothetical protein
LKDKSLFPKVSGVPPLPKGGRENPGEGGESMQENQSRLWERVKEEPPKPRGYSTRNQMERNPPENRVIAKGREREPGFRFHSPGE